MPHRLALAALALALPFAAGASELPTARALFDAHVEAIGGRAAVEQDNDGTFTGSTSIVEVGLTGDTRIVSRGKDHLVSTVLPNLGAFLSGRNGDIVWSMDALTGARLLQGEERRERIEMFDPKFVMRDASLIASATTTGLSDSEGRPCHRVEIA